MSQKPIAGRCGARTRKKPGPDYCEKAPTKGRKRCRLHGGASLPAGPDHPTYRHGRRSKVRGPLREAVEDWRDHADLLNMREPLAHLRAALERMVELADARDTPDFRRRMLAAMEGLGVAFASGDESQIAAAFEAALALCRRGAEDALAIKEHAERATDYVRAQESAWRVLLNARNAVPAPRVAQALLDVERIVEIEASDVGVQDRILGRIRREVIGGFGGPRAGPGAS